MADDLVRFQRVLHVREVERELTQIELTEKMGVEERIEKRITEIREEKEGALCAFCSGKDRLFSPQELWFERQNLDVIEKHLDENNYQLKKCRVEIEKTKEVLLERHRDFRLMEQYVDKVKERIHQQKLVVEQNGLDDITTMRYLRRIRGGTEV